MKNILLARKQFKFDKVGSHLLTTRKKSPIYTKTGDSGTTSV
jgi:hypothetical protein